ncbi:hypothetical protein BH18GEM1_BH18GEM1_07580 [soil metagenome]
MARNRVKPITKITRAIVRRRTTFLLTLLGVLLLALGAALFLPERYEATFSIQVDGASSPSRVPALEVLRTARYGGDVDLEERSSGINQSLVRVNCEGRSAVQAHGRCLELLEDTMQAYSRASKSAKTERDSLGWEARQVQERLSAARDSLEGSRRSAPVRRSSAKDQEGVRVGRERDELRAEADAITALITDLEWGGSGRRSHLALANYPPPLRTDAVASLVDSLSALGYRRAKLADTRRPNNPDLIVLDQQISDVESELEAILTEHENTLTSRIRSLDSALASASAADATVAAPQSAFAPRADVSGIQRRVDSLDELSRQLEARLRQADTTRTQPPPNVRVVTEASLPSERSFPDMPLFLILGSLLGLSLGSILALHRKGTEGRLGREDIEVLTSLPVLGVISATPNRVPLLPIRPTTVRGLVPRSPVDPWEQSDQHAALADVITKLDVIGCDPQDGLLRSLAITSTRRGEGGAFVACNLALLRAAAGRRTLLVDADFEAEELVEFFRFSPSRPGLIDVLHGKTTIQDACIEYGVGAGGRLSVLPAGNSFWHAEAEFRASTLRAELRRVGKDYDAIIVNSPPWDENVGVLPVTEAADAVVVVIEAGPAERKSLRDTLERLESSGGRVVGIVLNDPTSTD